MKFPLFLRFPGFLKNETKFYFSLSIPPSHSSSPPDIFRISFTSDNCNRACHWYQPNTIKKSIWVIKKKNFYHLDILQELFHNWCSFSPDELVTPSIGIRTKRTYSVVHYLSNKHTQKSVHQIDLELQLVLWKQLGVSLRRTRVQEVDKKKIE